MLQMFHLDVLKVDLDVAHVAMAIHACFKCFIRFRHMLQMFHFDISKVDLGAAHIAMDIHACFKCFVCFKRMLQMFHLDISKVDLVLRMLLWLYMHVSRVLYVSDVVAVCHLDVSKVDLEEAYVVAASAPHAPASAAAACMRARETKRAWGGPRACVGPRGLQSGMGAG
jgi:hypothetical protein